jgi:hypothetical protein
MTFDTTKDPSQARSMTGFLGLVVAVETIVIAVLVALLLK